MKVDFLRERLRDKEIIIMDGGTGTEILRRGIKTTLPLWSAGVLLTRPEIIQQIHEDYIKAGAEIIITNTFRTTKRTFAKVGMAEKAKEMTILACKLVRNAIKKVKPQHQVYIAGSIAPLEDCYTSKLTPEDDKLKQEHFEHAMNLKKGGVDFLLVETMITIKEAVFALEAAQKVGLPIAISFCCNDRIELLGGEKLKIAVKAVSKFNPLFLSINCSSAESTSKIMKNLRTFTDIPLGAYANGDGIPDDDQGWKFTGNITPCKYLSSVKEWINEEVQIVGGCCGTNPEFIKKISRYTQKNSSVI